MLLRLKGALERLRAAGTDWSPEPAVIICGASALLVFSHYRGSVSSFRAVVGSTFDEHPALPALGHFYWFGVSLLVYLGAPLLMSLLTRGSFHRRYGLGLGDVRTGLLVTAALLVVMVPTTYFASKLEGFREMYPLAGQAAYTLTYPGGRTELSMPLFVLYEVMYVAYFVSWEFLFRGWMLNGLLPHFGRAGAVLVQVAPFVVMHFGKAELEAYGSIIAGVALGLLALRTGSMWYGAILHGTVAVWMDVLSVWNRLHPGPSVPTP